MSAIFFQPWNGDRYGERSGKRVLVLGEAHYSWKAKPVLDAGTTRELVSNQISGDHTYAFWTHVARAFIDKKPTLKEKGDFWHTVAFSNYIQESVGDGPGIRPTPEMWKKAVPAFIELLERLTPQVIIVLGYSLWNHLPRDMGSPDFVMDDPKNMRTWRYPLSNGRSCLAYPVRHPSSGFNGSKWYPYIQKAIARA